MPDVLIHNVSSEPVARLQRQAAANGSSIEAEAREALEGNAGASVKYSTDELVDAARRWQDRLRTRRRNLFDSTELIREDRDSNYGRG